MPPLTLPPPLPATSLAAIEAAIDRALETLETGELTILGSGEVAPVIAWDDPETGGRYALKRLPPFTSRAQLQRYRALLAEYLDAIAARGVTPVPTRVEAWDRDDGTLTGWLVQPVLPPGSFVVDRIRRASRADALALFEPVLDRVRATVSAEVGLDSQLANWAIVDDALVYCDVSTPMLRDAEGRDRIDAQLFLAAMPWALRGVIERYWIGAILDTFHDPRAVVVDCLGNLVKERLEPLIPAFADAFNRRLREGEAAVSVDEIRRFYAGDRWTWEVLQRLRLADRFWQRRVRRRRYPFLLPPKVQR